MPITIVSATSRLTAQAKKATVIEGKRIEQIMLGINPEIFKPLPRHVARAKLQLPLEPKIIFAGATSLKMECKGMSYLSEALKSLKEQFGTERNNILIVTAGNTSGIGSLFDGNFRHKHLDSLTNDRMLAAAYQAADVFACPSIEDSGPMMINESIMCGTPVVSFEMGVAPDLVHTGKTGYIAELKNSEDLARGIKYVLDLGPDEACNMSHQCNKLGLQLCHPEIQAKAFKTLFDSLLNENRSRK
jgi:glycosyltransferase involved in cell wall biosynthesis